LLPWFYIYFTLLLMLQEFVEKPFNKGGYSYMMSLGIRLDVLN